MRRLEQYVRAVLDDTDPHPVLTPVADEFPAMSDMALDFPPQNRYAAAVTGPLAIVGNDVMEGDQPARANQFSILE